jgi:hypothetical protein
MTNAADDARRVAARHMEIIKVMMFSRTPPDDVTIGKMREMAMEQMITEGLISVRPEMAGGRSFTTAQRIEMVQGFILSRIADAENMYTGMPSDLVLVQMTGLRHIVDWSYGPSPEHERLYVLCALASVWQDHPAYKAELYGIGYSDG